MKKKLSCMASVLLAASLTACSGGGQEAATTAAPETTTAAPTTAAATTAAETTEAGALTAGTYTASKPGMNGQVTVEVVTDDSSIVSVEVTGNQETPGIGSPLVDGEKEGTIPTISIPAAIVENQTVAVDAVAGPPSQARRSSPQLRIV